MMDFRFSKTTTNLVLGLAVAAFVVSTAEAQLPPGRQLGQRPVAGQRPAAGPAVGGAPQRPIGPTQPTASPGRPAANSGALSPMPTTIAVLDVKKVFEGHVQFKQQMAAIDAKVKKLQEEMTSVQKWAQERQKALIEMQKGPDRDTQEAQVAQQLAQYRVNEAIKKKGILEEEAQVYYNTFISIERAVRTHCQRHRSDLVVRFDSRPADPQDRRSVMSSVNRSVVYQAPTLDITAAVLMAVNGGAAATARAPVGPSRPGAVRPGVPR